MKLAAGTIAVLLLMLVAAPLPAQSYGPPAPGTTEPGVAQQPIEMFDVGTFDRESINPISVLGGAAELIGGRGGQGGTASGDEPGLSAAVNIMVLLTVLTLVPSIMLMCTCFLRILVVLGLLKQAMGTQSLPPAQVVTGLALFMTLIVMTPTIDRIWSEAVEPFNAGEISTYDELWDKSKQPVRDFMFDQIETTGNWSSVFMVLEYRGVDVSEPQNLTRADVDMVSLVPAYMLSELKVAFLMGFRVYLPFLVIDMVIASMLISMSMMMLPPVLISLPFKLMLFVMVDGWTLIVGNLMRSFDQSSATALAPAADMPALAMAWGAEWGATWGLAWESLTPIVSAVM